MLRVMSFAFEELDIERLITFVNETNNYLYKLFLYVGFRLLKKKPAAPGAKGTRLMLVILKEDFERNLQKSYQKLSKKKFYNSFAIDSYR